MKKFNVLTFVLLAFVAWGCSPVDRQEDSIRLITVAPAHFHAALVQKSAYPGLDSTVYVYAPEGHDLDRHLALIEQYNSQQESPTNWNQIVYAGDDFWQRMIDEKPGNVVVLAGNNKHKTDYILQSISNGLNVLSDKPMAIDYEGFVKLEKAYGMAADNGLLLYDMMTERYEITNRVQRELLNQKELFGELQTGDPENPAIVKESVHHFYKMVSGSPLIRPGYYFDVEQQGDGIVDVTTHFIDLIHWTSFPETAIDYREDVEILSATRTPTLISLAQFKQVTGESEFPAYLLKDLNDDDVLEVYANGDILYTVNGIHAKVIVRWDYEAPEGAGDTHYSIMRGTKANLVIRQGAEQGFRPVLYIEAAQEASSTFDEDVAHAIATLPSAFDGVTVVRENQHSYRVEIDPKLVSGHEAHFANVTRAYLSFLEAGGMPHWEVPNAITRYYITTKALDMAKGGSQ